MQSNQRNHKMHLIQALLAGCAAVFLTALILAFFSWNLVLSFLAGALVLMLGHTFFFVRFFFSKNYKASSVINRFYTGALIKWLVLILGCVLAFKFNLALWPFVLSFIVITSVFYLVLFLQAYYSKTSNTSQTFTSACRSCAS